MTAPSSRLFLSPPHMSGRETAYVAEAFATNFIAPLGPLVNRFETVMANYLGIPYTVALASGTSAMHLAVRHLNIGPGDVVLASTLTFIGSVSPVTFQGAELMFIDSDASSWNMDPNRLAEAVDACRHAGRLPKAVIPTDLYGQCADFDALQSICQPHGIPVITDAAESLGAEYKGRKAGQGAYAAIYSFNGNKIITTSGGGLLATADPTLADHARHLATQARDPFPYYHHTEIGYNYRLSNVLAGIGLGQMEVLDDRVRRRRQIFERYRALLSDVPGLSFMPEPPWSRSNRWLTVVQFENPALPEIVRRALEADNIEARPVWKPMHQQPVFQKNRIFGGEVAERLFRCGLCLPSGSAMTDDDVARVAQSVRRAVGGIGGHLHS